MLAHQLRPCGPVLDKARAEMALETLREAADADGWRARLDAAAAALGPIFGAAPYLAGLALRRPSALAGMLASDPVVALEGILMDADAAPVDEALRLAKRDLHLLTALCDLGGVWGLDEVTAALTRFADRALALALDEVAWREREAGRLVGGSAEGGPIPGFFAIAMGKYGAFELNYSSDIDFSVFYEPAALSLAEGVEPEVFANRATRALAELLQARTAEGYVFRVDLRLRPDPSVTPPAAPVAAAISYYQSLGQNWERMAFIKARPAAGDLGRARAFLAELSPFIWRRSLDFAAIADIQSIKRQIHAEKVDERLSARGADVKLGHGGIREIEFFVQTQQLILGGRDPSLRSGRTLDALGALADAGQVSQRAASELADAYRALRALEHRAQMVADEQTHRLPEDAAGRRRIAAMSGAANLRAFDAEVGRLLARVNARYAELFAESEDLSSRFGSLVFTGVENDPETLRTLARMGFSDPPRIASTIRAWHHGHIAATRSEQGRELFTRLTPRLLEAVHATGAPDIAFARFAAFFEGLTAGVQVQALFLAQPKLFQLVVEVMAYAPILASVLARRPAALDAMLDRGFFAPLDQTEDASLFARVIAETDGRFESAMDAVRRAHRDQSFRIGVQVLSSSASAAEAGRAFADLADASIRALAPEALAEIERTAGAFPGATAVVALGKCGSREMTAGSDLDLMTLYRADGPDAASSIRGWAAETVYGRFTQRLIAALSAPTAEGALYEVDMRLRPSGSKGPVAVSLRAFEDYYAGAAETWELLALTRARVVWASDPAFGAAASAAIVQALRRPRDGAAVARDVREMRALLADELPSAGFWDLKREPGGLVDIEFVAQSLQLVHAAAGGPLATSTVQALAAMAEAGLADAAATGALIDAWRLQQDLAQPLKLAVEDVADPDREPKGFRAVLARAAGLRGYASLRARLKATRAAAVEAFDSLVPSPGGAGV
ncbi:MAG TPA: bifunctional [glutamine synthetase] adenylyltransferase/[glutamine synthetase]-adenylyl-L-tyrosine phosphorylase [Caulobacteraceae bacterium]|nr:bifunctional [glutamine synthetase] adenylyltransferase/[glutamine synthetase]-adenylyl-L-tyrosine phosphorylase [Caulobacteraceae bacterium]